MATTVAPLLAWVAKISAPLFAWLAEIFLGLGACLSNCKKLLRSFCLLWEVWYLLLLVGVPMVILIMKRFMYVTHIAYSLHDTKNV